MKSHGRRISIKNEIAQNFEKKNHLNAITLTSCYMNHWKYGNYRKLSNKYVGKSGAMPWLVARSLKPSVISNHTIDHKTLDYMKPKHHMVWKHSIFAISIAVACSAN